MKQRNQMIRWKRVWAATLMVAAPTIALCPSIAALLTVSNDSVLAAEESLHGEPISPEKLERVIRELGHPTDHEKVIMLLFQLSQLEDPQEQERLQGLLDARMQALVGVHAMPSEETAVLGGPAQTPIEPRVAVSEVPDEALITRIEMLNLGPKATADDLRAHDQLISEIAGIHNPIIRRELLTSLEEKEREQQERAEKP